MKQTKLHRKYLKKRLLKLYQIHDEFMKKFSEKRSRILRILNESEKSA